LRKEYVERDGSIKRPEAVPMAGMRGEEEIPQKKTHQKLLQ